VWLVTYSLGATQHAELALGGGKIRRDVGIVGLDLSLLLLHLLEDFARLLGRVADRLVAALEHRVALLDHTLAPGHELADLAVELVDAHVLFRNFLFQAVVLRDHSLD